MAAMQCRARMFEGAGDDPLVPPVAAKQFAAMSFTDFEAAVSTLFRKELTELSLSESKLELDSVGLPPATVEHPIIAVRTHVSAGFRQIAGTADLLAAAREARRDGKDFLDVFVGLEGSFAKVLVERSALQHSQLQPIPPSSPSSSSEVVESSSAAPSSPPSAAAPPPAVDALLLRAIVREEVQTMIQEPSFLDALSHRVGARLQAQGFATTAAGGGGQVQQQQQPHTISKEIDGALATSAPLLPHVEAVTHQETRRRRRSSSSRSRAASGGGGGILEGLSALGGSLLGLSQEYSTGSSCSSSASDDGEDDEVDDGELLKGAARRGQTDAVSIPSRASEQNLHPPIVPVFGQGDGFVVLDEESLDRESDERDDLSRPPTAGGEEGVDLFPEPGTSPFKSVISLFSRIKEELMGEDEGLGSPAPDASDILARLRDMGFSEEDVRRTLDFHQGYDGSIEDMVEELLTQNARRERGGDSEDDSGARP